MLSPEDKQKISELIDSNRGHIDAEAITAIGHVLMGFFHDKKNPDELVEVMGYGNQLYFRDMDVKDLKLIAGTLLQIILVFQDIKARVNGILEIAEKLQAKAEVKNDDPAGETTPTTGG